MNRVGYEKGGLPKQYHFVLFQTKEFRWLHLNLINPLLPATVFLRVPQSQTDKTQPRDAYRRHWGEGMVTQ